MPKFMLVVDGEEKCVSHADSVEFKSGSTGFRITDKCIIDGERYQVNATVTKIGSKQA